MCTLLVQIKYYKICHFANELQGPLINSKQFDRVVSIVKDAVGKGAQVVLGGEKHPFGDLYYRPTILTDLNTDMTAFKVIESE